MRADERHGLTLHVRAHERAVRVVVLEERHERGGDRHHLVRRDVHQLDHLGRDHLEVAVEAGRDEALAELALLVEVGRSPARCTCPPLRAPRTSATSSVTRPFSTLRYGVSTKPYSFTRANVDSDAMRPMFGPSGVSIGQMRP